jgi:hypothetical protein
VPSRRSRKLGQPGLRRIPNNARINAIVGVPQPVSHAANIAPGLVRHQRFCPIT